MTTDKPPTAEQLRQWDIRRAFRRGYVDGWRMALQAMRVHCPGSDWQALAAWAQGDLARWRSSRIDVDSRPPEPPEPFNPTEA